MLRALSIVPNATDLASAVQSAVFVLDTNVLLSAYRLKPNDRDELLQHLESMRERAFIPHRVAFEFERRRGTVLQEQNESVNAMTRELSTALDNAAKLVHKQHPYFSRDDANRYLKNMRRQLAEHVKSLRGEGETKSLQEAIENDGIAHAYRSMFADRFAAPYAFDEKVLDLCRQRARQGRPPGAGDAAKGEPDCYGDALIWLEVVELARRMANQRQPVVVVTGDFKSDWWQYEGSWRRTARLEMLDEIAGTGLETFALLAPREFLVAAGCLVSDTLSRSLRAVEK